MLFNIEIVRTFEHFDPVNSFFIFYISYGPNKKGYTKRTRICLGKSNPNGQNTLFRVLYYFVAYLYHAISKNTSYSGLLIHTGIIRINACVKNVRR